VLGIPLKNKINNSPKLDKTSLIHRITINRSFVKMLSVLLDKPIVMRRSSKFEKILNPFGILYYSFFSYFIGCKV
jgi:hypothetical protein